MHYYRIDSGVRQSDVLHSTFKKSTIKAKKTGAEIYVIIQELDMKFENYRTQLTAEQTRKAKEIKILENYLQV